MTIECVTLKSNHLFSGNPIAQQHMLRFRSIKERQGWEVPEYDGMEYDQYDNPATVYLIWRDAEGIARGVSRLYPTDRPFMLKEHFSHLAHYASIPVGKAIYEGSRFCIDNTIKESSVRERIARELIIAYLEYGLHKGIQQYIGIMYPAYWSRLFAQAGWEPFWLGDITVTPEGKRSRAGGVIVSKEALENVRCITGIQSSIIRYGEEEKALYGLAA